MMRVRWMWVAVAVAAVGCGGTITPGAQDGGAADGGAAAEGGAADRPADAAGVDAPATEAAAADALVDAPAVTYVTLAVDGDIAESGRTAQAKAVAALIAGHTPPVAGLVLVGDNARYGGSGSLLSFYQTYYQPATQADFGRFDSTAFPQSGNHEYIETNAQGYCDYFAPRMTATKALPTYHGSIDTVGKGWYSLDVNGWHLISLNSNCSDIGGGCEAGGAQDHWLAGDLAAHAGMPILAAWHAPRWACGGSHPSDTAMQGFWARLYDAHADFVFNGHNHYYPRWKPLDKASTAAVDPAAGLTEIVTGSGGVSTYTVCDDGAGNPTDTRVARQLGGDPSIGVLLLTLGSDGSWAYEYRVKSDGSVFDSGAGTSHNAL
jgi:hypothetical protein